MSRWIGITDDPRVGGSTLEDLETLAIPAPTMFLPATTAQVDPNLNQLNRDDEVRGRRANTAPISFASAPRATFECRAYPPIVRALWRAALGGRVTTRGVAPAAIESTVETLQSGSLPALVFWLLREQQLDRLTGCAVAETTLNLPIDGEGTVSGELWGLYHRGEDVASAEDPNGDPAAEPAPTYADYNDTLMLRDALAFNGRTGTIEIENLAGLSLTFGNGLIDDFRSRFRPGHNIELATLDGILHKLWYAARNKIGPQTVTGRIDLSDVDAAAEMKRRLTHAEQLVFEVEGGLLGTTPEAAEMGRFVVHRHVLTGGGAEPLQREGDQTASFEFTGYLDPATSKDLEATFTSRAPLV